MDTALIGALAGAVAGASTGFVAAWLRRPIAEVRAENTRLRNTQRREVVAGARAALDEAGKGRWSCGQLAHDRRFQAIRRYLPEDLAGNYWPFMGDENDGGALEFYDELMSAIDQLEDRWDLI
jgi:hypothetical protein